MARGLWSRQSNQPNLVLWRVVVERVIGKRMVLISKPKLQSNFFNLGDFRVDV